MSDGSACLNAACPFMGTFPRADVPAKTPDKSDSYKKRTLYSHLLYIKKPARPSGLAGFIFIAGEILPGIFRLCFPDPGCSRRTPFSVTTR